MFATCPTAAAQRGLETSGRPGFVLAQPGGMAAWFQLSGAERRSPHQPFSLLSFGTSAQTTMQTFALEVDLQVKSIFRLKNLALGLPRCSPDIREALEH